jgi:hypothetical protein
VRVAGIATVSLFGLDAENAHSLVWHSGMTTTRLLFSFRFCGLRERVMDTTRNLLREYLGPAQKMIANLIKIELAYININHPDFIGGSQAVARVMDKLDAESIHTNSESEPETQPESTAGW